MTYLAVNKDGKELICDTLPIRGTDKWELPNAIFDSMVTLPNGTIKKLIGKELTWNDEPVKF